METKADLHKEFETDTTKGKKIVVFKERIIELFDKLMNSGEITDPNELAKLAQLRAKVEIELRDF